MAQPFYTIGHSTRPFSDFVDLLRSAGVTFVADVRTVPRSRANPQYNRDVLPEALAAFDIGYEHIASLEHFSIRLGVSRGCEISFAFFFGNPFVKRGYGSPKLLNSARLHFA